MAGTALRPCKSVFCAMKGLRYYKPTKTQIKELRVSLILTAGTMQPLTPSIHSVN